MGLSTGVLTFATIYFGQARFTSQIKGMKRSTIVLSSSFFALTTGEDPQEHCSVINGLFQPT